MASTVDSSVEQRAIDFADPRFSSRGARYSYGDPFGVWSCKFSADGNEIIAGGTEMVFGAPSNLSLTHVSHNAVRSV